MNAEWTKVFVLKDPIKYEWMGAPFQIDGNVLATTGPVLVTAIAPDDAASYPEAPEKCAELTGLVLGSMANADLIKVDRNRLAEWAAIAPDATGCSTCRGTAQVQHNCDCPCCEVEVVPCFACQSYAAGTLLGGQVDRFLVRKLLAVAPECVAVRVGHVEKINRYRLVGDGWEALISGLYDVEPGPAFQVEPSP